MLLPTDSLAVTAGMSTVTAPNCTKPATTVDVVTREPVPSKDCDAPALTTVPVGNVVTTTTVYTITSCPRTVTNCPVGQKTTEIMTMTHGANGGNTGSSSAPTTVPVVTGGAAAAGVPALGLVAAIAYLL